MTSAAELFYTRRSRFGRNDPELGPDSPPGRISHHHNRRHHHHQQQSGNNIRRDRVDVSDCEPLRSPHRPRRFSLPDRESISLDSGSSQATSGDASHAENNNRTRDRLRSSGSERLPGAVLLARERLLQRLRGVSISGNSRRSNRVPASTHRNNFTFEDDFRLADAGDWETDISQEWLGGTAPSTDFLLREANKRPRGLSQEALELLHVGFFRNSDEGEEETQATAVLECSICLDAFLEGDKLICLPCGHRYHPCCLEPWIRTCGDCPYCRAAILMTSCKAKVRSPTIG